MHTIKILPADRCKDKAQEPVGATAATATVPTTPVATHKKNETNKSSRLRNLLDNYCCKEKSLR